MGSIEGVYQGTHEFAARLTSFLADLFDPCSSQLTAFAGLDGFPLYGFRSPLRLLGNPWEKIHTFRV